MAEVRVPAQPEHITGVILAGGRGSRMGGVDKGLQAFHDRPLVQHVLQRMQPQVSVVGINANRHLETYAGFQAPVWPDGNNDHAGPLSGFLVGLQHCNTPYLLTVPCDTPFLPLDLAARLGQALDVQAADIAMAAAPETDISGVTRVRTQPVFCLLRVELLASLQAYMREGGRKIDAWTAQHHTVEVAFDTAQDDPRGFFNINTLQELQTLQIARP